MSDDDIDAMFLSMTADLESDMGATVGDPQDVSELSLLDLSRRVSFLRGELLTRGEYIHPKTDECRKMHSELAACKVEIARRATNGH